MRCQSLGNAPQACEYAANVTNAERKGSGPELGRIKTACPGANTDNFWTSYLQFNL